MLILAPSVLAATDCFVQTDIPQTECQALVDLYNSTNGPSWTDSPANNWNVTNTPCSWTGVICGIGVVTQIQRSSRNLVGTLPSSLSTLTNLRSLNLNWNQLTGTIPDLSATALAAPNVYLNCNRFTGETGT
ncbi:MAG: hypothetical protein BWK79_04140, partial [Beggiatoa sp. IS2]